MAMVSGTMTIKAILYSSIVDITEAGQIQCIVALMLKYLKMDRSFVLF